MYRANAVSQTADDPLRVEVRDSVPWFRAGLGAAFLCAGAGLYFAKP